ncbi:MAG TPA: IPT/TIG domain-containing protein [Thermoanaerobaculia bacterium]|nr:IPT/TIG domain-containing protein [Thermoanaerobaculia bacterium]
MRPLKNRRIWLSAAGLAAALAAVAACSSHSPSEPAPPPVNPKVPVPVPVVNVTVSANPAHLTIGTTTGSNVTVTARLASNGQPPPDLTPVTLTTTLGEFGAVGSASQTVNLQLVGGQASAVLFPGASAGTATLAATVNSATVGSGSGSTTVRIDQAGVFFLSGVSPSVGQPTGGDVVTITGGGFIAPVSVTFGGNNAQVRSVSGNAIVVATPPSSQPVPVGQTFTVAVNVTNNLGGSSSATLSLAGAFTYAAGGNIQQPQVFSITPTSGTNDGGTRVVINGQGFVAPVQVLFGTGTTTSFNGIEATLQKVTPTQLVVVTPAANGFGQDNRNTTVSILIKNLSNGFATVVSSAFKYGSNILVTSVEPGQTIWNQPVKVTVFGQGFLAPVAVGLAGVASAVLTTSGTEVQVLSPIPNITSCADLKGPVSVTNISNGDSASGPQFDFIVPHPFVQSISPNSGGENGGTQVIIIGLNFDAPRNVQVTFGGVAGTVDSSSTSMQLIVTTPPFTGTFATQPCFVGSTAGTMKIATTVDVVVTNADTTCSQTLKQAFTYNPNDVLCHIPPPPPPQKPACSFTITQGGTLNRHVQFTDSSTNNPTSWTWDFGDGGSSAAQNPAHDYTSKNTFVVSLTVSNSAGSAECANTVTTQ